MKMNTSAFCDPFLRFAKNIKCPLGLSPFEAIRVQPGPSLQRTYEQTAREDEQRSYPKAADLILIQGAAVGLDEKGLCCHYWPGVPCFTGFLVGQNEKSATVKTGGAVVLKIDGLRSTALDRGRPVFCNSPNSFSLEQAPGAAQIGVIRYVEGANRAAVAFRRYDSKKPLNVNIK